MTLMTVFVKHSTDLAKQEAGKEGAGLEFFYLLLIKPTRIIAIRFLIVQTGLTRLCSQINCSSSNNAGEV